MKRRTEQRLQEVVARWFVPRCLACGDDDNPKKGRCVTCRDRIGAGVERIKAAVHNEGGG